MSIGGSYEITIIYTSGNRCHSSLATVRQKFNGAFKSESASIEISYGQVAGSSLFWDVDLTRQMLLYVTCSANIIKSSIKGAIKLGGLGNASFSGTRI